MHSDLEHKLKLLENKIEALEKLNHLYEEIILNSPIGIDVQDNEKNTIISSKNISKNKENPEYRQSFTFNKYLVNYHYTPYSEVNISDHIKLLQQKLDLFEQQSLDGYFFMMLDEPIEWNDSVDKELMIDYVFSHQKVTSANNALLRQYGYSLERFLGFTPRDFFKHNIEAGKQIWIDFFNNGVLRTETEERTIDGTPIFIKGEYICIYDEEGRITGHFAIQRDITQDQLIQDKIIKSEQRFYLAMQATNDGIWDWNLKTNEMYFSPNWKRMLGYDEKELANEVSVWENLTEPEGLKKSLAILNEHISGKPGRFEMEFKMKHKKGHWVNILSRATVYFNDEGEAYRVVGTHIDISESKRIQKELEDSKLRWKFAIEGNNDGLWDWNIKTDQVYFSAQWKKMLGYEVHEISNNLLEWKKRVHPDDLKTALSDIENYLEGNVNIYENEHRLLCKNGTYKWILDKGKIVSFDKQGKPERIIGTHRDINARKMFELSIADREKFLRTLIETTKEGFILLNENGLIEQSNEALCKLLDYNLDEVIGHDPYDFLDYENKLILENFKTKVRDKKSFSFEISLLSKLNENTPVIVNASILQTKNSTNSIFAFITDVSALKSAEYQILRTKDLLVHNEDLHKVGAWEYDIISGEMYLTQGMYKVLEISENKDIDHLEFILKCFNEQDREKVWTAFLNCAENGEKYDFILPFTTYKNNLRWVRSIAQPIFANENIIKVISSISDITEHVKIQDELRALNINKDKLFTIISHDLRSPFSAILGFSDLALTKIKQKSYDSIEKYCTYIQKSAKQSYDLLNNLLQWSRIQTESMKFEPIRIDIEQLVDFTVSLLSANSNSKNIYINQIIEPGLTVTADQLMIDTVIRNLLSNALKYTRENGVVTISAYSYGDYIKVSVEDNGIGIAENDVVKLFDLTDNFTTPGTENESGTGLGLILCKEFVEMHKGKIWVESELGKGANFIFTLSNQFIES